MDVRGAAEADVAVLAVLNHQLIQDEGHRNQMTLRDLDQRMRTWLQGEYKAVIFEQDSHLVAYALYRDDGDSIYLRHFFVTRDHRRRGFGRQAVQLLLTKVLPPRKRVMLDVLTTNVRGHAFWRALGFVDYAITMELQRS